MKKIRVISLIMAVLFVGILIKPQVFAEKYKDVPIWAEKAVERVDNEGILVGNINGEFEPDEKITKFKLVDVLAVMANYKDPLVTLNMSYEDKNYIKNAYNVNKLFIEYCQDKWNLWQESQNQKIAYLLQKKIIEQLDLNTFVYKWADGSEHLGYLTKEELTKYITCLLGLQEEALSLNASTDFYDDDEIDSAYKPYVALMKQKGIISGANNRFNPQQKITKVILAVVLNNVLDYKEKINNQQQNNDNTNKYENDNKQDESQYEVVRGIVKNVYDYEALRALRISVSKNNSNSTLYKVDKGAKIYDGTKDKSSEKLSDLVTVGDNIQVVIDSKNSIKKIYLNYLDDTNPVNPTNPTDNKKDENKEPSQVNLHEIVGVIDSINQTTATTKVKIKIQYSVWGQIEEKTEEYIVKNDAELLQNGKKIALRDIEKGSAIQAKVYNNYVYSADIKTKNHKAVGTILARKIYENKYTVTIVNEDGKKEEYEFTSESKIHKKGVSRPEFKDLKIGNYVTINAEFDKIIDLYTEADYDIVNGTIEKIEISKSPKISIKDENGIVKEYYVGYNAEMKYKDNIIDLYDLRLGYLIEVGIDGEEIYELNIINKFSKTTFEGVIEEVQNDGRQLVIKVKSDDDVKQYYLKRFNVSASTKIYKQASRLSRSSLKEGMRVISTLSTSSNEILSAIYVIE